MLPIKIKVDESFFAPEIRSDYTITEKGKKIWAIELDLFLELLRVCNKYDLKIFGMYGTLLGAIRHQGFIPWDDDMDFIMLRDDYEKLVKVAKNEFQYPYFLQNALSDQKFFNGYARFRNSETSGIISFNNSAEYNNGIFIDIFILDGRVENEFLFRKQMFENKILRVLLCSYYAEAKYLSGLKKRLYCSIRPIIRRITTYQALYEKYIEVVTRYNESKKVATITYTPTSYKTMNRSYFEKQCYVPYEFTKIPIPAPWIADILLRQEFGDYMRFPPVEERGKCHEHIIEFDPDVPYKEKMLQKIKEEL